MSQSITIGILETGIPADPLVNEYGNYSKMFMALFHQLDPELQFKHYSVMSLEYPEHIDECDAYLITGSASDSFGQCPWILRLKEFIVTLYDAHKPLIGICFGHQLIALTFDGMAERNHQGWGVGVYRSYLEHDQPPPWLDTEHAHFDVIVSHQDHVTKLPPNATLLAGNEFCPHAAYHIDHRVLCFQGHPEFRGEFSRGLMQFRQDVIEPQTLAKGMETSYQEVDDKVLARWILNFVKQPKPAV